MLTVSDTAHNILVNIMSYQEGWIQHAIVCWLSLKAADNCIRPDVNNGHRLDHSLLIFTNYKRKSTAEADGNVIAGIRSNFDLLISQEGKSADP